MDKTALFIAAYGLAAATANFLGGFLVSSRRLGHAALRYLIALGAGFMLATVFITFPFVATKTAPLNCSRLASFMR